VPVTNAATSLYHRFSPSAQELTSLVSITGCWQGNAIPAGDWAYRVYPQVGKNSIEMTRWDSKIPMLRADVFFHTLWSIVCMYTNKNQKKNKAKLQVLKPWRQLQNLLQAETWGWLWTLPYTGCTSNIGNFFYIDRKRKNRCNVEFHYTVVLSRQLKW